MVNGTTTRSPFLRLVTALPTSSTMPIGSWPMMSPSFIMGTKPSKRWRSEPQMAVEVTRMMASEGCWMTGSGWVSTRTSPWPCQVRAFMRGYRRDENRRARPAREGMGRRHRDMDGAWGGLFLRGLRCGRGGLDGVGDVDADLVEAAELDGAGPGAAGLADVAGAADVDGDFA